MIRLGMQRELWDRFPGYLEKSCCPWWAYKLGASFGWSWVVNELLVTAWDGIIRVFPCWPLEKRARFRDLRTKGGCLVSASCGEGRIETLTIHSERGGRLRLERPGTDVKVIDQSTGQEAVVERTGKVLSWDAMPGQIFAVVVDRLPFARADFRTVHSLCR